MCKENSTNPNDDPFLTIRQIADQLGISERSVWRLIEDGKLTAHKLGSSTQIRRSGLGDLTKRSRRKNPERSDGDDDGEQTP